MHAVQDLSFYYSFKDCLMPIILKIHANLETGNASSRSWIVENWPKNADTSTNNHSHGPVALCLGFLLLGFTGRIPYEHDAINFGIFGSWLGYKSSWNAMTFQKIMPNLTCMVWRPFHKIKTCTHNHPTLELIFLFTHWIALGIAFPQPKAFKTLVRTLRETKLVKFHKMALVSM